MGDDIAADVAALKEWLDETRELLNSPHWPGRDAWPTSTAVRVERVLAFLENQSRLCVALAERVKAARAEERERAARIAEGCSESDTVGAIAAAIREGK